MKPRLALISLYDEFALGIRSLHSVLKEQGIETHCIFYKSYKYQMKRSSEKELSILIKLLKDSSIDIVGISVLSTFLQEAIRLTGKIKSSLGIPVIWGGVHPTVSPQESLEFADFVFRGEAEIALVEFIKKWNLGDKDDIAGLWFKKNKEIKSNPPSLTHDLDSIAIPDFGSLNKYFIEDNYLYVGDPFYDSKNFVQCYYSRYHVLSFRGCPFNCSYCSNHALRNLFPSDIGFIRKRSVDSLIRELKYAKEQLGIKDVLFVDECFASDHNWLKDFSRLYKKEICLPFYCEMHPSFITEEAVSYLAEAGLRSTSIGIQSGSERVREKYFNRFVSDEALLEKAWLFKRHNVKTHYEIISDNPYETDDDKYKTLTLLLRLPRPLYLNVFSLNFFPGTDITKMALNDGLISEEEIEGKSDRGMQKFILKRPSDGKDTFWNYIYFLASDCFCYSGNIPGLRNLFSEELILKISKINIFKKHLLIFAWSIDLLNSLIFIKRKVLFFIRTRIPKKPVLFLKILLFSTLAPILIAILDPRKLMKVLNSDTEKSIDIDQIKRIIRYVNAVMNLRPQRNIQNICLVRCVILYFFLRREGLKVIINFGVKKESHLLVGHSWLTLDGNPYLEEIGVIKQFEKIYSFP